MKSENTQKIFKTIMIIVLTAIITFIITSITLYNTIGNSNVKYISSDTSSIGKTIQYFKNFIEKKYIGNIDENKMLESAIKGYVDGLEDEYSEYITADEMKEYLEDAKGNYVGIGVYIANNTQTNQIIVLMPIKGTPAEEAGLKSGDVITKIDGISYTGEELSKASNALKQQEGTKAKIEIIRDEETLEIEVERKSIKVNHIESKIINNNIGYIDIATFDEGCYDEFVENWNSLKEKNVKSLIIDLRNNGGGIVDEAINIADLMVDKNKTLLITTEKNEEESITKSKKDKIIDLPIVILVNENTASASEILTGALRDNLENLKVIGKTTYGKGVIQTIFSLKDGSGLKLTTNEYFTPKHTTINKTGIKPDVEVEFPTDKTLYNIEEKDDTQLQKAIELLK